MIVIGSKKFKFKKDALSFYRSILNTYDFEQTVNNEHLQDLIELLVYRPNAIEKIGGGIDFIKVVTLKYRTKCFELTRIDGTSEVFSYTMSINGLPKQLTKFSRTCRELVQDDMRIVKLNYFKEHSEKGFVKCQETGELCKWEDLNIDHRQPNTFSIIVDRFIEVNRIQLKQVEYIDGIDGFATFKDAGLGERFKNYHKEKANLRLVKKDLNLGRSFQARTARQKKDLTIR